MDKVLIALIIFLLSGCSGTRTIRIVSDESRVMVFDDRISTFLIYNGFSIYSNRTPTAHLEDTVWWVKIGYSGVEDCYPGSVQASVDAEEDSFLITIYENQSSLGEAKNITNNLLVFLRECCPSADVRQHGGFFVDLR